MNQRLLFPDILKSIAVFGVIIVHVSAFFIHKLTSENTINFIIAMSINFFYLWSVPIFIMISGMFLLQKKEESIFVFFRKRFLKIAIPFISWSIIYYIYNSHFNASKLTFSLETLTNFIHDLFSHKIFFHLWFVYMIMIMYALTPLLRKIVHSIQNKTAIIWLTAFFSLIFIANLYCFINEFESRTWALKSDIIPYLRYWFFMGYFILGYYLLKINLSQNQSLSLYGAALLSYAISITGTYYLTKSNGGTLVLDLVYYIHPPMLIISIAVFIFFKNSLNKKNTIFEKLSNYSYSVYLMHMLVLNIFIIAIENTQIFKLLQQNAVLYIVILSTATYTTCNCIAFAINKTPFLKKLL